ncbi:MAG: class I SAM-dependent methyltransferase [Boseongicola sp.]|nr:class I SAM-dependent methyltransferase [Boseongicola sp.]
MTDPRFWNKIARGYAKRPISNVPAYEQTLDHVRKHLRPDHRAIEVGCGTGSTAIQLAPAVAHYTGTDFSSEMVKIAQEKIDKASVQGLNFLVAGEALEGIADESLDVVLGFNLYHLVRDLEAALAAAHRVLKPGGLFITKTPCVAGMWYLRPVIKVMQLVGKAPYLNFLTPGSYDAAITSAGFDIEETAFYAARSSNRFVLARKH